MLCVVGHAYIISPSYLQFESGIEWLRSHGWLHRDISDGNLLLAREDPSVFNEPFYPEPGILLCRRPTSSPKGVFGLLHDFDMADLVDPVSRSL